MSSTTAWFYLRDGKQIGPIDTNELIAALRAGLVQREDLVWREGFTDWMPAGQIPELATPGSVGAPPLGLMSVAALSYAGADTLPSYAGFWKRVLASIIDWLVMVVPMLIVTAIIGEQSSNILSVVVGWLYYALMESSKHQGTLGKLALGIKVTDMDGQPISFGRASGRHFAKIISSIILGIGFLMVAFTEKKQGLHDIMASCLVVNRQA